MTGQSTGDFEGSETSLHDTLMVGKCHHTFVQTHRLYNTASAL